MRDRGKSISEEGQPQTLREELDSLQGTVFSLELILRITILAACNGRDKAIFADIASAIDGLPDNLRRRFRLEFSSKPAFERGVIGTIENIASYLRSYVPDD